jgi:hypothetical protein
VLFDVVTGRRQRSLMQRLVVPSYLAQTAAREAGLSSWITGPPEAVCTRNPRHDLAVYARSEMDDLSA